MGWQGNQRGYLLISIISCLILFMGLYFLAPKQGIDKKVLMLEKIPVYGIRDTRFVELKIETIKQMPVPDHGLFGIHCVNQMQDNHIFRSRHESFYNYAFIHSSLFEIYIFLRYLNSSGILPKKSLLISLPSPHIGRQTTLDDWYDMPESVYDQGLKGLYQNISWENFIHIIEIRSNYLNRRLEDWFDWKNVLYNIINETSKTDVCADSWGRIIKQAAPEIYAEKCNTGTDEFLVVKNGARIYPMSKEAIQPEDLYTSTEWRSQDLKDVKEIINAIVELGRTTHRRVYFIIPPVYGSRDLNSVNEIMFDKFISFMPKGSVMDERGHDKNITDFVETPRHPTTSYWDHLDLLE